MARMQSMQSQCCCCSISVFSALFGIIMLSTGVCLVLNYRIMEVDTSGLPPELRNEEGKKIVGIILICCGLGGMGLSALVTALYFTVCSKSKTTTSVAPTESGQSDSKASNQISSCDPYSTQINNKHSQVKNNSRHGKRSKKKRAPPQLKSYKTKLTPHPEVINENEARQEHVDLDESSRSLDSLQTTSSKTNSNHSDMKEGTSQDIMETSLQNSPLPAGPNPNDLPTLSNHQQLLKALPPPPIPASSIGVDPEDGSSSRVEPEDGSSIQVDPEDGSSLQINTNRGSGLQVNSQGGSPLQVNSNDGSTVQIKSNDGSSEKLNQKEVTSIQVEAMDQEEKEEEEEEEEVSQIEEIKKLDRDVANLLV